MDAVNRGFEAERILNDPLVIEALDKIDNGLISAMKQSAIGDKETHHQLVIALQVADKFKKNLKEVIDTGKLESVTLKEHNKLKQFIRRFES